MLTERERKGIENGNWDIDYGCGCTAECRVKKTYPVWQVTHLCDDHDPTVEVEEVA